MTLNQIDARLHLFKEYLQYLVEFRIVWHGPREPKRIVHYPNLMFNGIPCQQMWTFDQWLFINKHEDLIDFVVSIKVGDEQYWYDSKPEFEHRYQSQGAMRKIYNYI